MEPHQDAQMQEQGNSTAMPCKKQQIISSASMTFRTSAKSIQPVPLAFEGNSDLLLLVIKGTAFLWHQVWLARSTLAVRRS
jgi:hypothetical protein